MTYHSPPHAAVSHGTLLSPEPVGSLWFLGFADDAVAALPSQMEAYGYRVVRSDLRENLPGKPGETGCGALILDVQAGDHRVIPLVRELASSPGGPGIIVIDRSDEEIDRILALEAGADDCVTWPCGARELVARIRAIARRRQAPVRQVEIASEETAERLCFSGWRIDRVQRRLYRPGGRDEPLPAAEFAVLDQLLRQPRKIVSRETLLEATATDGSPETRHARAIDIQVSRLRKRLEIDGDEIIRTVRGRGYMLLPPVTAG